MQRTFAVVAAAVLVSMNGVGAPAVGDDNTVEPRAWIDVALLLAAAQGAPPMICAMAAQSVREWGWSNWSDAPSTPFSSVAVPRHRNSRDEQLPAADVDRLLSALASSDACVRELSVRLLGGQRGDRVPSALVSRLGSADAPMREIAAFGLGMLQSSSAVDPLLTTLRDAAPGVRANSAWALGRIENGRALAGLAGSGGRRHDRLADRKPVMHLRALVGRAARRCLLRTDQHAAHRRRGGLHFARLRR